MINDLTKLVEDINPKYIQNMKIKVFGNTLFVESLYDSWFIERKFSSYNSIFFIRHINNSKGNFSYHKQCKKVNINSIEKALFIIRNHDEYVKNCREQNFKMCDL